MLKFLGSDFQTLHVCSIRFMFGMMIDMGPKFYAVPSPLPYMTLRSGHRLRTFMLKFCIKVFRTSLFPNPMIYLVRIWYDG